MTAQQLADYIMDVHGYIQKDRGDRLAIEHTVEGGLHRLIKEGVGEWTIYKIYCAWLGVDMTQPRVVKSFTKLFNKIEEEYYERSRVTIQKSDRQS